MCFGVHRRLVRLVGEDLVAAGAKVLTESDEQRDVDRLERHDEREQIDAQPKAEPDCEPDGVEQRGQGSEQRIPELDRDQLDR